MANFLVLVNSVAFAGVFVLHAMGKLSLFSASFQKEGFCVKNSGDAYWSSHALAFYADCVGAAVLLALLLFSSLPRSAVKPLWINVPGILAHGAAHMSLSINLAKDVPETRDTASMLTLGIQLAFWLALLKATDPRQSYLRLVAHSSVQTFIVINLPEHYGFTYVQTVLLMSASLSALYRPNKDVYYELYALIVALPIGFVSWFESIACDSGFKALGGHFWYDATIPATSILYYALCYAYYANYQRNTLTKQKSQRHLDTDLPIKKIA